MVNLKNVVTRLEFQVDGSDNLVDIVNHIITKGLNSKTPVVFKYKGTDVTVPVHGNVSDVVQSYINTLQMTNITVSPVRDDPFKYPWDDRNKVWCNTGATTRQHFCSSAGRPDIQNPSLSASEMVMHTLS